jgi:hypothetical protein
LETRPNRRSSDAYPEDSLFTPSPRAYRLGNTFGRSRTFGVILWGVPTGDLSVHFGYHVSSAPFSVLLQSRPGSPLTRPSDEGPIKSARKERRNLHQDAPVLLSFNKHGIPHHRILFESCPSMVAPHIILHRCIASHISQKATCPSFPPWSQGLTDPWKRA